jgi:tetratricopeptide (TPR) repeat protein
MGECAPVVVMATSREPLAVSGERVLPVEPLPTEGTAGSGMGPAVELFVTRARASDPTFVVDDQTVNALRAICSHLDGMPLAIELAAARVRGLGVEGLSDHLDDRFRLLRNRGESDERHQTLRATVGWSYELLEPWLQGLFCRAAVFAGGFTLAAAEEVLAFGDLDAVDVADGLAELVDKSMLEAADSSLGRRYRMLETMRQFGSETIAAADRQQTHERFVRYYSGWCLSADRALNGPDAGSTFAQLNAEFDNVREALRLSLAAGQLDHAAGIVSSMHDFGMRTVNGEPWVWAIDLVERVSLTHPRYGDLLTMAIYGCRARGDRERMHQLVSVFEGLEASGRFDPSARSLHLLSLTYWFIHQTDRSVELHHRALTQARTGGDVALEAYCLATLSMAEDSFDRPLAEQSARASLALARSARSPLSTCSGLLALAGVVVHSEPEQAIDIADELIEVAHDIGSLWGEASGIRLKAHALSRAGQLETASATYAHALDLNGVGDFGELLWYTVLNIVEHLIRAGRAKAAATALGALNAAPAAPSDDLVTRAIVRMRARIESQLDCDPTEHEAAGSSMRLAELTRYLHHELTQHAVTSITPHIE